MREKQKLMFFFLSVALSLFLLGCGRGGDIDLQAAPFLGGSQGLEIKYLTGSPPEEVTDGNVFPFDVVVSLKNVGEYDDLVGSQVKVDLRGILATDFQVANGDITFVQPLPLTGKINARKKDSEGNIIDAAEVFVTVPKGGKKLNFGLGKISGNRNVVFKTDVCYQYQTKAVAQMCVLKSLIPVDDDAICDPSGSKTVFSSASPVGVVSFKQSVVGSDKIQFSFDVLHAGSGDVFENKAIGAASGCPRDSTIKRKEENFVTVKVKTGITKALKCSTLSSAVSVGGELTGKVRLVDGRKTVTCTQQIDTTSTGTDFEKNVDITVNFDYSDSIEKKVLVKHLDMSGNLPSLSLNVQPTVIKPGGSIGVSTTASDPNGGLIVLACDKDQGFDFGSPDLCTSSTPILSNPQCAFLSPWNDDATHKVNCRVRDAAGQESGERSVTVTSDKTKPETTATATMQPSGGAYTFDPPQVSVENVQITLACTDPNGNECASANPIKYCFTSGCTPGTNYNVPFTISDDGTTPVRYRSTDAAGNVEDTKEKDVIIDTAGPAFTIQYYSDSGLTISPLGDNPRLKAGTYYIKITASEPLDTTPTISIDAEAIGTDDANDVTDAATTLHSGNEYRYVRTISSDPAAVGVILEDISITGTDANSQTSTDVNPTNEATKAAKTDTTIPTITLTDPLDGATGVSVNPTIKITFSEKMKIGHVENGIKIEQPVGTPLEIKVVGGRKFTWSGDDTIVEFSLVDPLADGTLTTVTIGIDPPAGTIPQDLAGNPISAIETFTFTTA